MASDLIRGWIRVADRHVHPAEPLAVRLTLPARFSRSQ